MALIDWSRRNALPELMDAADTKFEVFRDCLIDLARVNTLTLAYRPTLLFFQRLTDTGRLPRDRTVNIVDVGSGSGDMLRQLHRWAQLRGYRLNLAGVDLNPWSAATARELTSPQCSANFITENIFDYKPEFPIDVVISSLFTHHLDDAAVIEFMRWMEANARLGWFINDLRRHPFPYHLFRYASRALRLHHFVQHDGPVSIARAFHPNDWRSLLRVAGVPNAVVESRFPFRLCVSRIKS